jgi:hypothetical protein
LVLHRCKRSGSDLSSLCRKERIGIPGKLSLAQQAENDASDLDFTLRKKVFNATNDTITTIEPTKEILQKFYPNVKVTREMGEYEAPLSNRKIREVLGFKDEHVWRSYVDVEKVKAELK